MNLQNRTELARYFNKKGFKIGAEIGVADGRYSEILCKEIPNLELYCIDIWKPYEKSWRGDKYQENAYQTACKRLSRYNTHIIRKSSLESSLDIPDGSLDFVFIDGSHTFNNVILDISIWNKKVKKGGIVAGHDYCHFKNSGVVEAVNIYTQINKKELNIIPRNKNDFKDDRQPCWWYVR